VQSTPLASARPFLDERGDTMESAAVAIELIESFNKGDLDRMVELCSPDITYIEKGTNRTAKGTDEILKVAQAWKAAFSDIHGGIGNSSDCGSTALLEITWTGTNDGPIEMPNGTLPATGKRTEFDAAQIFEIENGLVKEFRNYGDFITMLTQLGVIPG
jgi:steroid delta-isomerase-like uncharacterized protein